MKIIVTERKNGTRRVQHKLGGPIMTDQSYKKDADVNELVRRWKTTGIMPEKGQKQFLDLTQLPSSFEEAHDIVTQAWDAFNALPSVIRKKMGNDPANLQEFIDDPENAEILYNYGLKERPLNTSKDDLDASSSSDSSPSAAQNTGVD